MYVIGTAGHVDHGKSALVKALTGIDPDRLKEEKERGMTIDLGFAWLKLPDGQEVSIVDVPGHERFIKNMLAGVGGIDLALLIVAADEGVMPQTREHLAILDLLQVKQGTVVITKKDLVDADWLELVTADIAEALKGTTLQDAPMVATSAVTGEGLTELVKSVQALLEKTPSRKDLGRPRLPIDRSFPITGFGTVVTGTLVDGRLTLAQEVEVVPRGLKARVRGLQTHQKRVEVAVPGSRVAVNLSGVDTHDIRRGDVVTTPGWLRPTIALDARFKLLASVPRPLSHNAPVTFYSGTSESTARVRLLEANEIKPGATSWVQLRLDDPVAVVKGDHFILRSSWGTLGGGQITEPFARRHRRFHVPTIERLGVMEKGDPQEIALKALEDREPCDLRSLVPLTNLSLRELTEAMQALVAEDKAIVLSDRSLDPSSLLYSHTGWERLVDTTKDLLQSYHRQFPLRRGAPKEEARSRLSLPPTAFTLTVQRLSRQAILVEEGSALRLPSHEPRPSRDQQETVARYLKALASQPYSPPTDVPVDAELLNLLVERGQVVRVSEEVVFATSAYDDMVRQITEIIKTRGKVTLAEIRDHFGTTRKYAQALMEYLDQQHVTRRVGDERVLR